MGLATSRVWPPAGSATCVGVKSTPSEQSVASPRGWEFRLGELRGQRCRPSQEGVAGRAASSLTVAKSPRGAVLALPFVKWCVCVSLRGQSPRTATHTHSLSAAVRAPDKTPRPPAASRGRCRLRGARGWRSSLLGASFLFTSLELGPAQRQRRHCTRGAGEPARCLCGHARASRSTWGTDSSGGLGKTGNSSLARLSHCTPISGRKSQTPASTISFFPYRASWGFIRLFFPSLSFLAM